MGEVSGHNRTLEVCQAPLGGRKQLFLALGLYRVASLHVYNPNRAYISH